MGSEQLYVYKALEKLSETIRLIKILTTAPQTCCRLSVVSLKDSPVFSALSYMWGDASDTELINIDGSTTSITKNLAQALRDVQVQ
jgi:hypothetical protein